jgi:alkanesulfonate monooxygenase SsuD/methylene tetrahydromethanopterin reductase-like flavin-dependent oxidoreductase (luciferase family)
MTRGNEQSAEYLHDLSGKLESIGYESVLLVYHSKVPDFLTKAVRVMSVNQKLKYMIAIRTYAISPEYMAMICQSINEMAPNKIALNIVSGDIQSTETSIDDLVFAADVLKTTEDRVKYTDVWLSKFLNMDILKSKPPIIMGGHSNQTRQLALKYNATHLSMINRHKEYLNTNNPTINPKQMICFGLVFRENQEEADKFAQDFFSESEKLLFICGTKQHIKDKIKELKLMGITDLLIHDHLQDPQSDSIHDIIKEMIEEQNGIN